MGLLDSFEKGIERAVNGAFAKTFRSGVQPVEIASALRSELDKMAAVVTRERVLAPNEFQVLLSPQDLAKMSELGSALRTELDDIVQTHARSQGYSFAGPVTIELARDEALSVGTLRVTSRTIEGAQLDWQATLLIDGRRYPITAARTVIGRGSDADITIPDSGTSRRHVEVLWDGERGLVHDLGSTNGSKLDGAQVKQSTLRHGQTITIGRTDIIFEVVPRSASGGRR